MNDEVTVTNIIVTQADSGTRLDTFAAKAFDLSRNHVQRHIEEGNIQVNFRHVQKKYEVKPGDTITCTIPQPEVYKAFPEPIPLDIVYEDNHLIVINKPQGMVAHPAQGNLSGTLVNGLLYHCKDLSGVNGVMRPGIVHRLDKDTSGLIAVAKHDKSHHGLAAQLENRTMGRTYYALVKGIVKQDNLTINQNIGRHPGRNSAERKKMAVLPLNKGKTAITHITVLQRFTNHTLVEAKLETGRTHQIRVHMAYKNHPILGDPIYGQKDSKIKDSKIAGQILHAKSLQFIHPITGELMNFDTDLPGYFSDILSLVSKI